MEEVWDLRAEEQLLALYPGPSWGQTPAFNEPGLGTRLLSLVLFPQYLKESVEVVVALLEFAVVDELEVALLRWPLVMVVIFPEEECRPHPA